jgi:hypothetical protein
VLAQLGPADGLARIEEQRDEVKEAFGAIHGRDRRSRCQTGTQWPASGRVCQFHRTWLLANLPDPLACAHGPDVASRFGAMRALIAIIAVFLVGMGCAQAHQRLGAAAAATEPHRLYFAVEVVKEGKVVASPKLLGESGRRLVAERRAPGAETSDYRLSLTPELTGDRYRIDLDLRLPDRNGHTKVALLHGEERSVELGKQPGDLAIRLMVMRVDSPEFQALMGLLDDEPGVGGSGAI